MAAIETDIKDEKTNIILSAISREGEVWRHVRNLDRNPENYDYSFYVVSSHGRLINTNSWTPLHGSLNREGYIDIGLTIYDNGSKKKGYFMHRIIAFAFLEKPPLDHTMVDHKDRVRDFNHLSNLEWVTPSGNSANRKANNIRLSGNARPIYQRDNNNSVVRKWSCLEEIKESGLYPINPIAEELRGKLARDMEYSWEYADTEELLGEVFCDIPVHGMKDYQVSNKGRIKCPNGRIKYGYLAAGYRMVSITLDDGTMYKKHVHTIVMLTFNGPPEEGFMVNHKDLNTQNNVVENLEYVDSQGNSVHASLNGVVGKKFANGKAIIRTNEKGEEQRFESIEEAKRMTKFGIESIKKYCDNSADVYGYIWEYPDDSKMININKIFNRINKKLVIKRGPDVKLVKKTKVELDYRGVKSGEEWVKMEYLGYESFYISSLGRAAGNNRRVVNERNAHSKHNFRVMKSHVNNNNRIELRIDRIVIEAFSDQYDYNGFVKHIDHNKHNDSFVNLKMISRAEYNRARQVSKRLKALPVLATHLATNKQRVFESRIACGNYIGRDGSTVRKWAKNDYLELGYKIEIVDHNFLRDNLPITVSDISSGMISNYKNIGEVIIEMKMDKLEIENYIMGVNSNNQYKFEYSSTYDDDFPRLVETSDGLSINYQLNINFTNENLLAKIHDLRGDFLSVGRTDKPVLLTDKSGSDDDSNQFLVSGYENTGKLFHVSVTSIEDRIIEGDKKGTFYDNFLFAQLDKEKIENFCPVTVSYLGFNEVRWFENLQAAADNLQRDKSLVELWLFGIIKNGLYEVIAGEKVLPYYNCRISLTDVETGEKYHYETIKEVSRKLFVSPNDIIGWLYDGQVHEGYLFKNEDFIDPRFDRQVRKSKLLPQQKGGAVMLEDIRSGNKFWCCSLNKAEDFLYITTLTIQSRIDAEKPENGYNIEYANIKEFHDYCPVIATKNSIGAIFWYNNITQAAESFRVSETTIDDWILKDDFREDYTLTYSTETVTPYKERAVLMTDQSDQISYSESIKELSLLMLISPNDIIFCIENNTEYQGYRFDYQEKDLTEEEFLDLVSDNKILKCKYFYPKEGSKPVVITERETKNKFWYNCPTIVGRLRDKFSDFQSENTIRERLNGKTTSKTKDEKYDYVYADPKDLINFCPITVFIPEQNNRLLWWKNIDAMVKNTSISQAEIINLIVSKIDHDGCQFNFAEPVPYYKENSILTRDKITREVEYYKFIRDASDILLISPNVICDLLEGTRVHDELIFEYVH